MKYEFRIVPETDEELQSVMRLLANCGKWQTPTYTETTCAEYDLEQVVKALQDYGHAKGAVALRQVLEQVGARRATDIAPERFAEVMALVS
jgi:hypothetical protein